MAESLVVQPSGETTSSPPTADGDRVPTFQKVAWGIGGITDNVMANGIQNLAVPIYQIALGVNPIWIGWAMAIPRFFDVLIDPFIGNISDNTRSPWGRRRPYIVAGAIISAIFFTAVWWAPMSLIGKSLTLSLPIWGTVKVEHLFIYFLFSSMLYYLGYAIFTITQGALGYEMSMDYNERTRIMAWKSFFANASGVILPAIPKLSLWLPKWIEAHAGRWPDFLMRLVAHPSGVKIEAIGIRYVAMAAAVMILVAGVIPGLFCKERVQAYKQPKINVFRSIYMSLSNIPFMILAVIIFTILVGLFVVNPLALYINVYYVCNGNKDLAYEMVWYIGTIYAIMGVIVIPPISWIGTHYGKRQAMLFGQISVIVAQVASLWLFTPKHPYWQILQPMLCCPGLSCVWVLSGSMMADICDLDELKYGTRREGIFGAVFGMIFKAGVATVGIVAGYIMVYSGINDKLPMQTPETLWRIRSLFAFVPVAFLSFSAFLTWIFPITEKSAREVRAKIDARKKAAAL